MNASVSSALAVSSTTSSIPTPGSFHRPCCRSSNRFIFTSKPFTSSLHHPFILRVTNDSSRTEQSPAEPTHESSEADKIINGMDFGELCNEFECISSPQVESTARQLVRDILELREGNRALGTFAVSVTYKDPVRCFTGREKYKRPLWATGALDKPSVTVQEMTMLSTSILSIKWTITGKPKSFIAGVGGDLTIKVHSKFTLNQISGQVIEHEEFWDLSASSVIGQAFFWTSRRLFATIENGKDLSDLVKSFTNRISSKKDNLEVYPDPSGDPTKVRVTISFEEKTAFKNHLSSLLISDDKKNARGTVRIMKIQLLESDFTIKQNVIDNFWKTVPQEHVII